MQKIKPVDFISSSFYLNGAPMKIPYSSMRHLHTIYNSVARAKIFKFGRQTHKSTTIGCELVYPCIKYSNYHALYVAPTGQQVSVFSTDKLDSCIRGSDVIRNNYLNTQTKDQISYKELSNGSKIYLRSSFHTADGIRGISADRTTVDEVQDMVADHLPVIEQSMSHSIAHWQDMKDRIPNLPQHLFNSKIYAGTPKTVENTMENLWSKSTQCEWIIKCQNAGCGKHNYINENNIGDTCLICNKCGKPIFYRDGQWVAMNTTGFIEGYRMPQIVLDWVNNYEIKDAWKINVINTRKIYSGEKFHNEVLALPYASAKHPISVSDLKRCCIAEPIGPEEPSPLLYRGIRLTAGIDWGKGDTARGTSYTILTIGGIIRGKFRTVFMKKYEGKMSDALLQVADILRIIRKYNAEMVMADTGDGRTSNAMMVEALGAHKFVEMCEHGTIKQKIKWDSQVGHYIMNRTRMFTDMIMQIKRMEVEFFRFDEFEKFSHDFAGIFSHYSETSRMTIYDHTIPDDAFHSWMFANVSSMILHGKLSEYLIGS